jgi:hypothetical protein
MFASNNRWIVGLADRFFEVLVGGGKKKALRPLLMDLLIQREYHFQPNSESDDSSDDYIEDGSDKQLNLRKLANDIVKYAALHNVAMDLSVFTTHLREGSDIEEAHGFLTGIVLENVSKILYQLQLEIKTSWVKDWKLKPGNLLIYCIY